MFVGVQQASRRFKTCDSHSELPNCELAIIISPVRVLTRYVLREVISHAAIGAGIFTFVIFMRDLGRILELVVRNSAPLPSVAEIFFFTLPTALTITIPMGVLVGILIGLSRLAADSEVTAMRASGLGAMFFVRVILIFAIAAWLFGLANNVLISPRSAAALGRLQNKLKSSQASFEIQPRVFYEDFKNYVLYVQDVKPAADAALWHGVFLADLTQKGAPKITLAQEGVIVSEGENRLRLNLINGSQQETQPKDPSQYSISTFAQTDIPIQLPEPDAGAQVVTPVVAMSTRELWQQSENPELYGGDEPVSKVNLTPKSRYYRIEFHRRFALPTACLVLALVGVPLGLSAKKGGKSTGFVLTILLVFLYYFASLSGVSFARQGRVSPWLGVWLANMIFFVAGALLIWKVDKKPIEIGSIRAWWNALRDRFQPRKDRRRGPRNTMADANAFERSRRRPRVFSAQFPLLIDDLILRDFGIYFSLILTSFVALTLIFTMFELLGDVLRNRIPAWTLGAYLLNVTPSMIYTIAPLTVMLAVLVTFGLLQKSNEVTAMKATGTSVYRIVFPVLMIAAAISGALFFFDQVYIPHANKRQETLRNQIKGKPAQTYLRPDRKWIFGQKNTIYYYEFFDPDQNHFANISAFEFNPATFQLTRRIYGTRAHWEDRLNKWVFEEGWERTFNGSAIVNFRTFDVSTFAELTEEPNYFKKEIKQSQEMNYEELRHYINDLRQSGFDVTRLRVQWHKKFAYPVITFVMAVLAVPFAMSSTRKGGALTGVAIAIGAAVIYLVTSGLFEAMGNANQLPAALAAWAPDLIFGFAGGYLVLKVPS